MICSISDCSWGMEDDKGSVMSSVEKSSGFGAIVGLVCRMNGLFVIGRCDRRLKVKKNVV